MDLPLSFLSSGMVLSNEGVVFIVGCSVLLDVLSSRSFNVDVRCCSDNVKEADMDFTSLEENLFGGNFVYNEVRVLGSAAEITEISPDEWTNDIGDTLVGEYIEGVEVTDCKGFDETILEELTDRWEWWFVVKSSSEASKFIFLLATISIEEAIMVDAIWFCVVVRWSVFDDMISDNWSKVVVSCKDDKDISNVRRLLGSISNPGDDFNVVDSVE